MGSNSTNNIVIEGIQHDLICSFNITQIFYNSTDNPVEIEYIIPTRNELCLYETCFYIGNEKIKVIIQELQSAQEIYKKH